MISIANRYVLRQIWAPAVQGAVVICVVVMGASIQDQLDYLLESLPLVQAVLSMIDLSRIAVYSLPSMAGIIIPVTYLLGIMLTFGQMAHHNELTALKSAGIPLKRLVLPVIAVGAVLSGLCFFVQDQGRPWAYHRVDRLVKYELPIRVTFDVLPTGVMNEFGDWRVFIGKKDPDGALREVMLLMPLEHGQTRTFYADSAALHSGDEGTRLLLRKGHYLDSDVGVGGESLVFFEESAFSLPKLAAYSVSENREGKTLTALRQDEAQLSARYAAQPSIPDLVELRKVRIELSERLSFPLMCLAFAFVAAPIGVRAQRGGRSFTFVSGVAIVGFYFILRNFAQPPGLAGLVETIALMQVPNLIFCLAGFALLWRVDRI
ncbi:MAG: LptF/LptG family permease [Candidatus Hydrogenedentes bacterium]|nr:LptF/LptG family permease [Candidatus Hydrogenedentota bacterium]